MQEFAEDIKQAMVRELRASYAAAGNALSGPALNPLLAQANRFCEVGRVCTIAIALVQSGLGYT
eukprot:827723-Pelagomonas_calceolata.AAC.1